jgi:hypothetical protein
MLGLPGFPIKMADLQEMKKDGDKVSLGLSYASLILLCCFVFYSLYCLVIEKAQSIFNITSAILFSTSFFCYTAIYFTRIYFLSDMAKFRRLDKLQDNDYNEYEKQLEAMKDEERLCYLKDADELNLFGKMRWLLKDVIQKIKR